MADERAGSPADVVREWWRRIDGREWERLGELLHPDVAVSWPASGEEFDARGIVDVNRRYPGRWHATLDEVVAAGETVASRTTVTGGRAVFYAAGFWTVRAGRVTRLVELWSERGEPPADRRP